MAIEKPEITRKMAWIAFYLEAGWIVLNILLIFLSYFLPVQGSLEKIPVIVPILTAGIQCLTIPFVWSCLKCALQKEISEQTAVWNLLLPVILYEVVGNLLSRLLDYALARYIIMMYSTAVYGEYAMRTTVRSYFGIIPVPLAAFVLICCASAIEIYIFKHKES